jgi:hypothetical protein
MTVPFYTFSEIADVMTIATGADVKLIHSIDIYIETTQTPAYRGFAVAAVEA